MQQAIFVAFGTPEKANNFGQILFDNNLSGSSD